MSLLPSVLLQVHSMWLFIIRLTHMNVWEPMGKLCSCVQFMHTQCCHLSTYFTTGFLPAEPSQLAATMIYFFQEFHQHWPLDTAPIHPSCCQDVLAKLTVTSESNKVYVRWVYVCKRATVYIVSTSQLLHYIMYYTTTKL